MNRPPVPSDLAISLEFAEHVSPSRSEWVVDFLTRSATTVLFSAAIPQQNGVGHVNEQWPAFWAELFARRGFTQLDVIRPLIISDEAVPYWYRQNLFLDTADPARFASLPTLLPAGFVCIHDTVAKNLAQPRLRTTIQQLGPALVTAVRNRLPKRSTSPVTSPGGPQLGAIYSRHPKQLDRTSRTH